MPGAAARAMPWCATPRTRRGSGESACGSCRPEDDCCRGHDAGLLPSARRSGARCGRGMASRRRDGHDRVTLPGLRPVRERELEGPHADVAVLGSTHDLAREVAWMHTNGVPGLFGFVSHQDPKQSENVIAFAGQGGLGLPDRDYYVRSDSATAATRAIYVRTTANLLQL